MFVVKAKEDNFQFKDSFIDSIHDMGFSYVSLGFKKLDQEKILSIFSHKNWQEEYVSKSYFLKDPLLNTALKLQNIFILWDCVAIQSKDAAEVMSIREKMCDVRSGITLSSVFDDTLMILAIAGKENSLSFSERYLKNFDRIKHLTNGVMNEIRQ